jgi:hypothetical protein
MNKTMTISLRPFSDSSLLVDELTVEKIIPNGERVILVIWARPFYE